MVLIILLTYYASSARSRGGGSGYLCPGRELDRVGVRAHLSVNNPHTNTI